MDIVYIMLAVLLVGLIMVGIFVLGMITAKILIEDAQDESRYDRLREEYYQLAGFRKLGDPAPYVPPRSAVIPKRKTPRRCMLPCMDALERLMREGKRGTIMWSAKDRKAD